MVIALSAVLVWVVTSRAMPGGVGRLRVVCAYVLALVPALFAIALVEAVLVHR